MAQLHPLVGNPKKHNMLIFNMVCGYSRWLAFVMLFDSIVREVRLFERMAWISRGLRSDNKINPGARRRRPSMLSAMRLHDKYLESYDYDESKD
jgi:hypothetical protein